MYYKYTLLKDLPEANKNYVLRGGKMDLGSLDLDTRFEYLIIYKDKRYNTINTWTLGCAFELNY